MNSFTRIRGARLLCALTSCCFALAVWFPSPSFAAAGANGFESKKLKLNSGNPAHAASGSFSGTLVRTVVALLVVIAVIYGLSWILKQGRQTKNPSVGDGLTQIASLPLGANRSVTLVRVGAELHMLGVAEHGVSGIRVFSEEEAYELGIPFDLDDLQTPNSPGNAITRRLIDALRRMTVR
ncbi:MAG TPA: flagellar biosynthetic protein FliO [Solirubrobacteraceae bacterium]|jgi:flagellar protein FliO/FliZ|nr:flagellar biosynthetic protein FliO [Solirubrobacteraceae bacterium]